MNKDVLQQAVEALTSARARLAPYNVSTAKINSAIDALESALQQQPEPVAEVLSWTNSSYSRNYKLRWLKDVPEGAKLYAAPPALQQQEVPREPVAPTNAAWVQRLRETAEHLRKNSLSLAKYPGMSDEARARELAALYIGEIAELFEAKRRFERIGDGNA